MISKGERTGGKDWEFKIRICKLLYIGQMNNKVLLYNTGNYIQHRHNGKEYLKKEYLYVYNKSLCYTTEIGTML